MPPSTATTAVPAASRPLGSATTVPAHSMPVTLATSPKVPLRMYASAWFSPNARTAISTSPAAGTGSGNSVAGGGEGIGQLGWVGPLRAAGGADKDGFLRRGLLF